MKQERDKVALVISTYDTDWLLVSADKLADAARALEGAGHRVIGSLPEG
jgi:hypothetical protein